MKREAIFQTLFNQWCRAVFKKTAVFELKQTKKALLFSTVKSHQLAALRAVKHGVFVYKIPDEGFCKKPFDSFCLTKAEAFVVIKYPAFFVGIDVDAFIAEASASARKSLTQERAEVIHSFIHRF